MATITDLMQNYDRAYDALMEPIKILTDEKIISETTNESTIKQYLDSISELWKTFKKSEQAVESDIFGDEDNPTAISFLNKQKERQKSVEDAEKIKGVLFELNRTHSLHKKTINPIEKSGDANTIPLPAPPPKISDLLDETPLKKKQLTGLAWSAAAAAAKRKPLTPEQIAEIGKKKSVTEDNVSEPKDTQKALAELIAKAAADAAKKRTKLTESDINKTVLANKAANQKFKEDALEKAIKEDKVAVKDTNPSLFADMLKRQLKKPRTLKKVETLASPSSIVNRPPPPGPLTEDEQILIETMNASMTKLFKSLDTSNSLTKEQILALKDAHDTIYALTKKATSSLSGKELADSSDSSLEEEQKSGSEATSGSTTPKNIDTPDTPDTPKSVFNTSPRLTFFEPPPKKPDITYHESKTPDIKSRELTKESSKTAEEGSSQPKRKSSSRRIKNKEKKQGKKPN